MKEEHLERRSYRRTPIVIWVLLGVLLGIALIAAFIAYGQPELLLDYMSLRYCG